MQHAAGLNMQHAYVWPAACVHADSRLSHMQPADDLQAFAAGIDQKQNYICAPQSLQAET